MDFNRFSAQRRAEDRASRARVDVTAHDAVNAELTEAGPGPSARYARRFFPFRHHYRNPHSDDYRDSSISPRSVDPHAFSTLFSIDGDPGPTAQMLNEVNDVGTTLDDRTMSALPRRLRRGGIRAPESLSARRGSATYMLPSPSASSDSEVRLLDGPALDSSTGNIIAESLIEASLANRGLPTPPFTENT